jgi:hypothetical protein
MNALFATIYALFLCFINVKLGKPFVRAMVPKINISRNAEKSIGWTLGFLALFPLMLVVPEHMPVIAVSYGLVGGIWSIIYYDYIAKKDDED